MSMQIRCVRNSGGEAVADLTLAKIERQTHMATEVRNTAIFLHPYMSRMAPKNGQMMPANSVPGCRVRLSACAHVRPRMRARSCVRAAPTRSAVPPLPRAHSDGASARAEGHGRAQISNTRKQQTCSHEVGPDGGDVFALVLGRILLEHKRHQRVDRHAGVSPAAGIEQRPCPLLLGQQPQGAARRRRHDGHAHARPTIAMHQSPSLWSQRSVL